MPFFGSTEGRFGYGRPVRYITPANPTPPSGNAPSYYTANSGFLMYQPGYTSATLQLKSTMHISTTTNIRAYTGIPTGAWTIIHDKDLDSNVFYSMVQGTRVLTRSVLTKGGTTTTNSTMYTYAGTTAPVLGACYAPACMWTSTMYGAFIIGGFTSSNVHVMEFSAQKTIANAYAVPYLNEVYGTEVVPKAASGFSYDFGVAYTRSGKIMSSWTVDMLNRSWTNRVDNTYGSGTTGPANGDGMIYYPIGKSIHLNDNTTDVNRIAMNDTSSALLYLWRITQSGTALVWSSIKNIPIADSGGYPYHLSHTALSSIV
jgi:hypothetical protein